MNSNVCGGTGRFHADVFEDCNTKAEIKDFRSMVVQHSSQDVGDVVIASGKHVIGGCGDLAGKWQFSSPTHSV